MDLLADGEVVAFSGRATSFERLQQRMQIRDPQRARNSPVAVYYYLFDLLELDGRDIRILPLRERKRLLRKAVAFGGRVRFTPHRTREGEEAFAQACRRGWEGLIAKRADSLYVPGRSRDWLKLKCVREQELVIGGWTDPRGTRQWLGALLVGYWEGDKLRYAGRVGTGFDAPTLERLAEALRPLERETPPFWGDALPRRAHWVQPELVA